MSTPIHVSVAWPYANGDLHLGHVAGALLPSDIFARYHRLKGNRVLMVSGSDAHGTPTSLEAARRGISPRELFEHYHRRSLAAQQALGILDSRKFSVLGLASIQQFSIGKAQPKPLANIPKKCALSRLPESYEPLVWQHLANRRAWVSHPN